jgi:hypothetical protein
MHTPYSSRTITGEGICSVMGDLENRSPAAVTLCTNRDLQAPRVPRSGCQHFLRMLTPNCIQMNLQTAQRCNAGPLRFPTAMGRIYFRLFANRVSLNDA